MAVFIHMWTEKPLFLPKKLLLLRALCMLLMY